MAAAVAVVHEQVHERARENEQGEQGGEDMPGMFGQQEEACYSQEAKQDKAGFRAPPRSRVRGARLGVGVLRPPARAPP
jgi:hypothetical protein